MGKSRWKINLRANSTDAGIVGLIQKWLLGPRYLDANGGTMKGILSIIFYAAIMIAACIPILTIPLVAIVLALTFLGEAGRAQKAEALVATTLMEGEQVTAQALQFRAFALFNRRAVIAITDSRVLVVRRGLLGGFTMSDIQWKDLKDVKVEQNVLPELCGSNLAFLHLNAATPQIFVNGIASQTASTIYSRAQREEQSWEEKRRVRAMEEVRAAAGGVVVHAGSGQPAAAPAGNRMVAEIQQAKDLLDAGTISDAEFQEMKSKILSGT
ncbi:MAG: SHOCT domain-containing protein [Phenylobacterium sp.]|nr:SHOCT domain-containing protein [Phenylobacterium sp.]